MAWPRDRDPPRISWYAGVIADGTADRHADEIRLVVQPIVLGGGKPLFKDVNERHALTLLEARPLKAGAVRLKYHVPRRQRGTAAEG